LILFEDRTTGQDRATIHGWKDCRARRAALSPGPGQAEAGPDAWSAAAIWTGTCEALVTAQPFASVQMDEFYIEKTPKTHGYMYRGVATK